MTLSEKDKLSEAFTKFEDWIQVACKRNHNSMIYRLLGCVVFVLEENTSIKSRNY
jgi:hypothetical protein